MARAEIEPDREERIDMEIIVDAYDEEERRIINLTSICSFISSLLTIGGGAWLGRILTAQLSKYWLQLLSGLLLIGLGTYEYFGV
jgi:putative Mn2+ efflux pump MntP